MRLATLVLVVSACSAAPVPTRPSPPAARWQQRFVDHAGVTIEYRVRDGAGIPVVLIPGMTDAARTYEGHTGLLAALGDRTLIAISLRGRGASGTPDTGWTPADHHGDIAAVVAAERLQRYHLVGHSMGAAYAIGFALDRPTNEIVSFTSADYFPAVIQVSEEWAQNVESKRGDYDPKLARHILREQGAADYTDRLGSLAMPMLVVLGTESMEPRVEQLYAKAPRHRVMWIAHGHDTFAHADAVSAIGLHVVAAEKP